MNEVLIGKYKGCSVTISSADRIACIKQNDKRIYLTRETVDSYSEVKTSSSSSTADVVFGAAVAGTVGAIAGATPSTSILLEIKWKDGDSSLLKINNTIYEAIIVGMYKEVAKEHIKEIEEKDIKSDNNWNFFSYLIGFGWLILYLIGKFS